MSITNVLRRDLGSQFRQSRNLGETLPTKCRRVFWATVFLAKALRIAVAAIRREQLGSRVVYEGGECFISNWSGSDYPTLAGACGYREFVPRAEIRNVLDAREVLHRFKFGLSFYLGCHYGNDVNRRIYRADKR